MKTYIWNNAQLKRRNKVYSWVALGFMGGALVCVMVLPAYISSALMISVVFMGLALVLMLLSRQMQTKDKKLGKK